MGVVFRISVVVLVVGGAMCAVAPEVSAQDAASVLLPCTNSTANDPPRRAHRTVAHDVALPTRRFVVPVNMEPGEEFDGLHFGKHGLWIARDASVQLLVPPLARRTMELSWGDATRTTALTLQPCPGRGDWIVFAGGFSVSQPGCYPLVIRDGTQDTTVVVSLGARCPPRH